MKLPGFLKIFCLLLFLLILAGQTRADWTSDVTPPNASLTMTIQADGTLKFTLAANDPTPPPAPSGLASWKIEMSSDPAFPTTSTSTSTISGPTKYSGCPQRGPDQTVTYTPAGSGNLYFRAKVTDCAGNIGTSSTVNLSAAWLQTQAGDIHSNTLIQTNPGPTPLPSGICPYKVTNPLATGLISTPGTLNGLSNNAPGYSTGLCVTGDPAAFVSYKMLGYNDLKSLYFDQSKASKATVSNDNGGNQGDITSNLQSNDELYIKNDLNINGNIAGTLKPFAVFVRGNFNISKNITYGDSSSGLVFVVNGDVNIDQSVTEIDAVIISQGTIYTAGAGCATSSVRASQLVVQGSFINLDSAQPIVFCRNLANNTQPAEKIIQQPKYLVILKDLFADTYQKWSEIQ